jgi:diketogulonate reductase-like aldo/keto reductase
LFVQNRCYASTGWDADTRAVCRARGIGYQGFSLLTANRRELQRPAVDGVMQRSGLSREQVVFRFAIQVGMIPLTGTSNEAHMREDLVVLERSLSDADVRVIEAIAR